MTTKIFQPKTHSRFHYHQVKNGYIAETFVGGKCFSAFGETTGEASEALVEILREVRGTV